MAILWVAVILYKWIYSCAIHVVHVYACGTECDFTWILYTADFTWTLQTTDNKVCIQTRMYTRLCCFELCVLLFHITVCI